MTLELTAREFEVWQLTAQDMAVHDIAASLGICRDTVWRCRQNVMGALDVNTDVGLTRAAVARGIVKVEPVRVEIVVKPQAQETHLMTNDSMHSIIIAVIVGIPPTILAFATLRSSWKHEEKADKIIVKADEIHSLTDGQLSKVTSALAVAMAKIEGLDKMIASMTAAKTVADIQQAARVPVAAVVAVSNGDHKPAA